MEKNSRFPQRLLTYRRTALPAGLILVIAHHLPLLWSSISAVRFENTTVDLDLEPLDGSFEVVTAFEVLEHLYNPLHALLEVKRLLAGEDARLFVSMPLRKPIFLASPDHFHEMTRSEALSLFTRAGFTRCPKCGVSYPSSVVLSYRSETAVAGMV